MKKKCLLLFSFVLLLSYSNSNLYAQCATPEKIIKGGGRDKYTISKQSKSGALKPGESYELTFNTQEGYDYKITSGVDGRNSIPIAFEVFENTVEKTDEAGFKKVKKSIMNSDGSEPVEFKIEKANILTIKVTLPASDSKKPECVAILIEDRKSIKIGF